MIRRNARKKIKIAVIVGTRPEAIKLVPIIKRLSLEKQFEVLTIASAQHREMLDQVLDLFGLVPDYDLDIMVDNQSLCKIVSNCVQKLDEKLKKTNPQAVLVQGDTTTTFVASLVAFYNRIPVAHVEAGLRTGDRFQPFPEEVNRRLTSMLTTFHFAPTLLAKHNLLLEGVSPNSIFVTGNSIIDAFQMVLRMKDRPNPLRLPSSFSGKKLIFVTAHRRENLGRPLKSICMAVREIVKRHPEVAVVFPVHYNPNVRQSVFPILSDVDRICLLDPLDYLATARMIQQSTLILTDSGGIQEEAPSLGKPVLVMRNKTERPEGIEAGTAKLVGTSQTRIVGEVSALLSNSARYKSMATAANPYGDGRASDRIVHFLLYAFGRRPRKPTPFVAMVNIKSGAGAPRTGFKL